MDLIEIRLRTRGLISDVVERIRSARVKPRKTISDIPNQIVFYVLRAQYMVRKN